MPGTVLDVFTGLISFNLHNNLVRYLSAFIKNCVSKRLAGWPKVTHLVIE